MPYPSEGVLAEQTEGGQRGAIGLRACGLHCKKRRGLVRKINSGLIAFLWLENSHDYPSAKDYIWKHHLKWPRQVCVDSGQGLAGEWGGGE